MRPIDADKFLARIHQYEDFECPATETAFKAVSQIRSLLWDEPIITLDDLRPKGLWVRCYNGGTDRGEYCCSECDAGATHNKGRFCWYCGADMRGEANG